MIIFTVFSNKNGLSAGAWWIVTKRRDMRCSGLADVENDKFYSVFKQEGSVCEGVVDCDKTPVYAMFWACGCLK